MKKIIILFIVIISLFIYVAWDLSRVNLEDSKIAETRMERDLVTEAPFMIPEEEPIEEKFPSSVPEEAPADLPEELPVVEELETVSAEIAEAEIADMEALPEEEFVEVEAPADLPEELPLLEEVETVRAEVVEAEQEAEIADTEALPEEELLEAEALVDLPEELPVVEEVTTVEPVIVAVLPAVESAGAMALPVEELIETAVPADIPEELPLIEEVEEVKPLIVKAEPPVESADSLALPEEELTEGEVSSVVPEEKPPVDEPVSLPLVEESLVPVMPPPVVIAKLPSPDAGEEPELAADKPSMEGRERIALLPLENLTEETVVVEPVMPVLISHLEKKGFAVVYGGPLDDYTCKERVRTTGFVSRTFAAKLKEKFNVKAIMTGSIVAFSPGENPGFSLFLRLIDSATGTIIWADFVAAKGTDFAKILGLGGIKNIYELIPRVMEKLFVSLNNENLHRKIQSDRRVAVMPFLNNSGVKNAGKIAMYLFLVELLKNNDMEPIEYGDTRNEIIKLRLKKRGELDYGNARALAEPLGAKGVLLGVVGSYSDGVNVLSTPSVSISARLIDSGKSKIVWYNSQQRNGKNDEIKLDWGKEKSAHAVAHNIVEQLVNDMGSVTWID